MAVRNERPDRVALSVSIDTEEDNWDPALRGVTVANIQELPALADQFRELGVRATYFTTYRVAEADDSAAIMRALAARGDAEIGAHLHAWNTPPESGIEGQVSMLLDYPVDIQRRKLQTLMEALRARLEVEPRSFRAGRFGIGQEAIAILHDLGVLVDSSVTPFVCWGEFDGPSFIEAPSTPYRLDPLGPVVRAVGSGAMVEIPITVGFMRTRPRRWPWLARALNKGWVRTLRLPGIAARTVGVRRVILSPETSTAEEMLDISRRLVDDGATFLHMYFHSSSLKAGLTPFTPTAAAVRELCDRISRYCEGLGRIAPIDFVTVSEAAAAHHPGTVRPVPTPPPGERGRSAGGRTG